jgi:hypothetical protein
VNFFLKDRYKNSTDHKLLTQADTVLDGMPARQLLLYDYDEGLIGSGTTGKVLRILAFDNTTNNGYSVKFWSHPQIFDKYLPVAKKMISAFRIGNQSVSEISPIANNTEEKTPVEIPNNGIEIQEIVPTHNIPR